MLVIEISNVEFLKRSFFSNNFTKNSITLNRILKNKNYFKKLRINIVLPWESIPNQAMR